MNCISYFLSAIWIHIAYNFLPEISGWDRYDGTNWNFAVSTITQSGHEANWLCARRLYESELVENPIPPPSTTEPPYVPTAEAIEGIFFNLFLV